MPHGIDVDKCSHSWTERKIFSVQKVLLRTLPEGFEPWVWHAVSYDDWSSFLNADIGDLLEPMLVTEYL